MCQMLGVLAEFERSIIAERVRAGLARHAAEGKRLGRPPIAAELENAPERPQAGGALRAYARSRGVDPISPADQPPFWRRKRGRVIPCDGPSWLSGPALRLP